MKFIAQILHQTIQWRPLVLGAFWVGAAAQVAAQVAITGVTYGTTSNPYGNNVTVNSITYNNAYTPVTSVSTVAGDYNFNGPVASSVVFRRGSTGSNTTTAWYQTTDFSSNGGYTVYGQGDSTPTASELMLAGNLSEGLRNPFANTVSLSSIGATSNIERIDFYFAGGYTVQAGDALAFFDLENYGNNGDGFRISAFTSLGTVNGVSNSPTAYANSGLFVTPGSYGDAVDVPGGGNTGYLRSTTTNGDSLTGTQSISVIDSDTSGSLGSSDLSIVGILIRFTDLGLTAGQTIYGFSLMAGDVTASSGSQLVNWNNTTVYPTTTNAGSNPNADYGNVDFAGFGAQISRPVPEPATYGAILLSVLGVGLTIRRRRQNRSAVGA